MTRRPTAPAGGGAQLGDSDLRLRPHQGNRPDAARQPAGVSPIEGAARNSLFTHAQEAIEKVETWLNLLAAEPTTADDFRYERAHQCRNDLLTVLPSARLEIQRLAHRGGTSLPVAGCCREALGCLDDIQRLLDPNVSDSPDLPARHVLHAELLCVPRMRLDDGWEPSDEPPEGVLAALLEYLAEGAQGWVAAFERRMEAGDHLATERVLEYLEATREPDLNLAALHPAASNPWRTAGAQLRRSSRRPRWPSPAPWPTTCSPRRRGRSTGPRSPASCLKKSSTSPRSATG